MVWYLYVKLQCQLAIIPTFLTQKKHNLVLSTITGNNVIELITLTTCGINIALWFFYRNPPGKKFWFYKTDMAWVPDGKTGNFNSVRTRHAEDTDFRQTLMISVSDFFF